MQCIVMIDCSGEMTVAPLAGLEGMTEDGVEEYGDEKQDGRLKDTMDIFR